MFPAEASIYSVLAVQWSEPEISQGKTNRLTAHQFFLHQCRIKMLAQYTQQEDYTVS